MPDEYTGQGVPCIRLGPPGTGKTTYLTRQIQGAAEKYGIENILVASFTRTAAQELVGRNANAGDSIGTLHSHCYRAIGYGKVAESNIDEFNKAYPHFRLSAESASVSVEDAAAEAGPMQKTVGDELFHRMNVLRARMVPQEMWPQNVRAFHRAWHDFKHLGNYIDFTDMIEIAYHNVDEAPGSPVVGFFDEAQDFTPLELALIRKWGRAMEYIVMAGDDDQTLYSWLGATPDVFLEGDPDEKRVLSQSYRVPAAVHRYAERWIRQVQHREEKEYKPRDMEGELRYLETGTYMDAEAIVNDAQQYLEKDKTVMFLASCSYMLADIIRQLKKQGIVFHNPYRIKQGAWNPIRLNAGDGKVTTVQRLIAYMSGCVEQRLWYPEEFQKWVEIINSKGNLKRGAKKIVSEMEPDFFEIEPQILFDTFDKSSTFWKVFNEFTFDNALDWFCGNVQAAKVKALEFPAAILKKHKDLEILTKKPQVIVGTIHSVKGGEADCSPGDEPVLTTNRGYVPIAELDPETDYLVSFNSEHHKIHRGGPARPKGYRFKKAVRPYSGRLLVIETPYSRTRVTPNHHITVRWSERALNAIAVYLMKRGHWWRIGVTKLHQGKTTASGITTRLMKEKGDCAWILGLFDDYKDALYHEQLWSHAYGIPDLTFEQEPRSERQLSSEQLHSIWDNIDSETPALKLLNDFGLSPEWPMWKERTNGLRRRQTGIRNRWLTRAANLIPGYMEIPTDPGHGQEPRWSTFTIKNEWFEGPVYSLEVEKWHHYVSGGAIVHNCVYLFPDLSASGGQEWERAGAGRDGIIRQFYVGATRARESLVLCEPYSDLAVPI